MGEWEAREIDESRKNEIKNERRKYREEKKSSYLVIN